MSRADACHNTMSTLSPRTPSPTNENMLCLNCVFFKMGLLQLRSLSKFIVNINLMGQRVKRKLKLCSLSKCQFPSAQGTKSQKLCHLYRDTCIAVQNYTSDSCQSSELINSHGGSCVRHGAKTTTNGGYFIFWYFIFWRTHFSTRYQNILCTIVVVYRIMSR